MTVVRNAVDEELLRTPLSPVPGDRRMVYVGTLSERFDATLAGHLLDRLPDWRLDLFGQCRYAQMGTRPGSELVTLLARDDGRVRWHGPVGRDRLAGVLDSADVLLLPNRAEHSRGQDSMKLYDYCARARPIVASDGAVAGMSESPPRLRSGRDADALAALVSAAPEQARELGMRARRVGQESVVGLSLARLVARPVRAGGRCATCDLNQHRSPTAKRPHMIDTEGRRYQLRSRYHPPDPGVGAAQMYRQRRPLPGGCGFKQAGTHPDRSGYDRGAQRRAVALRANC